MCGPGRGDGARVRNHWGLVCCYTPGHISEKKTKSLTWKDMCTPMFIAALFTVAKIWKQPKYPSTQMSRYTYSHTVEYYLAMKEEWNFAICSNMGGLGECYAKWNKSETDKYCMDSLICGIYKIQQTNEYNRKERLTGTENRGVVTSGETEGEIEG